jgi:hypothetical protein
MSDEPTSLRLRHHRPLLLLLLLLVHLSVGCTLASCSGTISTIFCCCCCC